MIRAGAALASVLLATSSARAQDVPRRTTPEAVALYGWSVSYGAATGGAVALLAGPDDLALTVSLPLAGAGVGALAAYLADRGGGVRRGVPTALATGGALGAIGGGALALEGLRAGWSPGAAGVAAWGAVTVGMGAGLLIEATLRPDPGTTSWLLSGATWGAALAGITGVAAGDAEGFGRWVAVGAAAGALVSLATARALRPTQARTRWLDLGAAVGGALGLGAGLLLFSRPSLSIEGALATTALGVLGGGAAGYALGARDDDPRQYGAGGGGPRLAVAASQGTLVLCVGGATPF